MIKKSLFLFIYIALISCGNESSNSTTSASSADFAGYTLENISGTAVQKAVKYDGSNVLLEEGQILNNQKTGTWTTYFQKEGRIKNMTTFLNGKKNGAFLELNDRGSVNLQCNYKDDILHGKWVKFRYGTKIEREATYNMGQYDGAYREYHSNGKMQKEIYYKNGVQDGKFRQFNDQEQVIMEYEYKNGEKISGGIVTPPASE